MWQIKRFKLYSTYICWIAANKYRYQITPILLNNAYGVEYRALRKVY